MNEQMIPPAGPLDVDPTAEVANLVTARRMLGAALGGIPQGAHDRRIIRWITGKDISVIATVASLLRRAFEAGLAAGRAELVDEQPTVQTLRAEVDALARQVERTEAARQQAYAWWRDAQAERDAARAEADDLEAERNREEIRADQLRAEVAAADRDRDALTRILATAADVSVRFDAEKVSAQGAFERLLQAIADAGGCPASDQGRLTVADHWFHILVTLRREAETRLGVVSPGDQSVCMDPVYGAALDAWQAWRDSTDAGGAR